MIIKYRIHRICLQIHIANFCLEIVTAISITSVYSKNVYVLCDESIYFKSSLPVNFGIYHFHLRVNDSVKKEIKVRRRFFVK